MSAASDDALDIFNVPFTPPMGERSARWTAGFAAEAPLAERHGQDGVGDRDPESVLRAPAQRPPDAKAMPCHGGKMISLTNDVSSE